MAKQAHGKRDVVEVGGKRNLSGVLAKLKSGVGPGLGINLDTIMNAVHKVSTSVSEAGRSKSSYNIRRAVFLFKIASPICLECMPASASAVTCGVVPRQKTNETEAERRKMMVFGLAKWATFFTLSGFALGLQV